MASLGCVTFTSVESQYKNGSSASRLMVSGAKLITQSFLPNKADGTGQRTPEIQEVVFAFYMRHAVLIASLAHSLTIEWRTHTNECLH